MFAAERHHRYYLQEASLFTNIGFSVMNVSGNGLLISSTYKMRPGINYKKMPEEKAEQIKKGNDTITVRLNQEERAIIEDIKKYLAVDRDSTALKEVALIGYHDVLHGSHLGKIVPKIVARIKRGIYDSVLLNQEKMSEMCDKEGSDVPHLND